MFSATFQKLRPISQPGINTEELLVDQGMFYLISNCKETQTADKNIIVYLNMLMSKDIVKYKWSS